MCPLLLIPIAAHAQSALPDFVISNADSINGGPRPNGQITATFQYTGGSAAAPLDAYDVTFSYNPLLAAMDPNLVTFDTHLGGPDNSLQFATAGLDTLELTEVSTTAIPFPV